MARWSAASVALLLFACGSARAPDANEASAGAERAPELDGEIELVESFPVETTLDDPELREASEVWVEMIGRARSSLDFLEFYGASEPGGRLEPVIAAIEAAAARGVVVRFVFDAGFHARQPEIPDRLAQIPGVELRLVDYAALTGGVQHAKLFVVDESEAYVGSQNFDWRSLEHIQELGVRVTSPALVAAVHDVFALDWALAGGASLADARATLPARADEPVVTSFRGEAARVRIGVSPRDLLPADALWDWPRMRAAIAGARERVRLQVMSYQIRGHDDADWRELDDALRAAAARGVQVELLVSAWETRAGRIEALQSLAEAPSVDVRLVRIPEASSGFIPFARTIHAKYLTIDGSLAWVGTSNAGGDYFLRSRNVGFFVESEAFTRALDAFFDRVWSSAYAEAVDPARVYEAPRIAE